MVDVHLVIAVVSMVGVIRLMNIVVLDVNLNLGIVKIPLLQNPKPLLKRLLQKLPLKRLLQLKLLFQPLLIVNVEK